MKSLFTILLSLACLSSYAQFVKDVSFDSPPEIPFQTKTDTTDTINAWQIGTPIKTVFSSAYSGTRALVTDTSQSSQPDDTSVVISEFSRIYFFMPVTCYFTRYSFWQKLDIDTGDVTIVEVKYRNTWYQLSKDTIPDTTWKQRTDTIDYTLMSSGTAQMRFTFIAGPSTKIRDGWIIDSLRLTYGACFSGIDDANQIAKVEVFPNPSNDRLTVLTPSNDDFVLCLLNVDGKKMLERAVKGNERIDISALPAGFYFYQVYDGNDKPVKTGKLNVVR